MNFTTTKTVTAASLRARDDRNGGARDSARLVRGEEHDEGSDLIRGRPARRIGPGHREAIVRSVDDARQHAVGGHALALELVSERLGTPDARGFGHRVAS